MSDPVRYSYTLVTRDNDQLASEIVALNLPGYLDLQTSPSSPSSVWVLFSTNLTGPQKTTLDAAIAAHTPDPLGPVKRLRAAAKAILAATTNELADAIRAVALAGMSGDNALRGWVRSFVTLTAASTTLVNFQSRVAALGGLPDLTKSDVMTAVTNRLDAGDADT